jgi:transcriptional regulator with XRE-family HTH domain
VGISHLEHMPTTQRERPRPDPVFGAFIRSLRKAAEETQLQFAESIGVSNSTLSRIERAEEHAPIDVIMLIAERAGVSLSAFYAKFERFAKKAA